VNVFDFPYLWLELFVAAVDRHAPLHLVGIINVGILFSA